MDHHSAPAVLHFPLQAEAFLAKDSDCSFFKENTVSAWIAVALAATLVVLSIAVIVFVVQRQKRKHMNSIVKRFSELVSRHGLYISSQTILQTCVLALDGINRKMIVQDSDFRHCIIDLDEVRSCTVRKTYRSIHGGELEHGLLDGYLQEVLLCFEFKSGKAQVEIPFYQTGIDPVVLAPELEHRAKDWEAVLSKMLSGPLRKTA